MYLVRTLVACTLALGLFLNGSTADAAKPKAKKKHPTHGVVTALADGTVTVKVHISKKKAAAAGAEASEKKFTLSEGTKFVKVTGKKKDRVEAEGSKDDLKVGSKVLVEAVGDTADKVTIQPGKTKKKKQTT